MADNTLRISWSRLQVHEHCKQKSFLISQKKQAEVQNVRNFYKGNVVDKAMRQWLAQENPVKGQMAASIKGLMRDVEEDAREHGGVVRWLSLEDKSNSEKFCLELVTRLEDILFEYVIPFEYDSALRFKAPLTIPNLNGSPTCIYLIGELDLLTKYNNEYRIWDLKATADDNYWRKTIGQLIFYDVALFALYKTFSVETGLFQPMCSERIIKNIVSAEDRRSMLARIVRMAHDIWRNDRSLRADTKDCSRCIVNHACPRFQSSASVSGRVSFGSKMSDFLEGLDP